MNAQHNKPISHSSDGTILDPQFASCRHCLRQVEADTQESGWWERDGGNWICPGCLDLEACCRLGITREALDQLI